MLSAGSSAPWWAVPIVAGAFTLVGVLISQWMGRLADKRRFEFEDDHRFHNEIQLIAAKYLRLVDDFHQNAVFANVDNTHTLPPIEPMWSARAELELVCPAPVILTADQVFGMAQKIQSELMMRHEVGERIGDFEEARRVYLNSVRHALGMPMLGRLERVGEASGEPE